MTITIKTNLPQYRDQIKKMGGNIRAVVRVATLAGAQEFRKEARLKARKRSGVLRRNIVVKRPRKQIPGAFVYVVGVRAPKVLKGRKGGTTGDAFYWRFLEQGWLPRGPGKKLRGGDRSRTAQRQQLRTRGAKEVRYPFLEPAFQSAQGKSLKAFYQKMDEGVAKERVKR